MPVIDLYTVKHLADRVANEPRNVGVIASTGRTADDQVATRFLGVDIDGSVSRTPLPGYPKDIYLQWVAYFNSLTRSGRWDDIERARARRPQDFYLEHALTLFDEDNIERAADTYFTQLVRNARKRSGPTEQMRESVDAVFAELDISPIRDKTFTIPLNDTEVTLQFDYLVERGESDGPLLLDQLTSQNFTNQSQAFAYRAQSLRSAGLGRDFGAFVDLSRTRNEQHLRVVESVALIFDPLNRFDDTLTSMDQLVNGRKIATSRPLPSQSSAAARV